MKLYYRNLSIVFHLKIYEYIQKKKDAFWQRLCEWENNIEDLLTDIRLESEACNFHYLCLE